MREYTVKSETTVTDKDIAYWIITAFEGGIQYWCDNAKPVVRDEHGDWVDMSAGKMREIEDANSEGHDYAHGGPLYAMPEFWDNDKVGYRLFDPYEEAWVPKVLTLSAVLRALKYQPPKKKGISPNWYRKVVDRLISENYDAGDADSLVQIAVFNELVYG